MSETRIAQYEMNPAEDVILFGDKLADGMRVLPESRSYRRDAAVAAAGDPARQEQFRRIRSLRRLDVPEWGGGVCVTFVGEWADGYKEIERFAVTHGWIVKCDAKTAP